MKLSRYLIAGLVIASLITGIWGVRQYEKERAGRIAAELAITLASRLNDSTTARLALAEASKDSLGTALRTSRQLNGQLQAALRIRVPARDTVIQHDLVPVLGQDSTRTATFRDSTFAGTVEGTVTAPPCCANLGVSYRILRPEFNPTVAFVRVSNKIVATVTWSGEQAEIEAPYFKLPPAAPKRVGYWVEGNYNPVNKKWTGEGGVLLRLPALIRVQAGINTREEAFVGVRKEF